MTKETMSVHKALSELKIMENRITNAIGTGTYCIENKHSNEKIKGVLIDDYKKVMQGNYDKATDLIKRYNAIKKAVVLSNANTTVMIGEKEYTVAEAIYMNNHGVQFDELLLLELRQQYQKAQAKIAKQNEGLSEKAEQYVIGIYGAKEGKVNTDDFEKAQKDFITSHEYELLDPINVLEKIEMLDEKISKFKSDFDSALSTSNAITQIEIEY